MSQNIKYHFPENVLQKRETNGHGQYFEFFDNANMRSGIYTLTAGQEDPQGPHLNDELYYVMEGSGKIRIGDQIYPAETGDVIFVPARAEHKFVEILSDLKLLVFFTKADN